MATYMYNIMLPNLYNKDACSFVILHEELRVVLST